MEGDMKVSDPPVEHEKLSCQCLEDWNHKEISFEKMRP
jgi:hypothetical protein